jgi:hypothetical protein
VKIYAFEWNDCVLESVFSAVSLHKTMAGARKAMRKVLLSSYKEDTEHPHRMEGYNGRYSRQQGKALEYQRWRVVSVIIQDD